MRKSCGRSAVTPLQSTKSGCGHGKRQAGSDGDGELDSSSVDSEDEDELTCDNLLRDVEKPSTVIGPAAAPTTQPSYSTSTGPKGFCGKPYWYQAS
jgi:hypothetical protein